MVACLLAVAVGLAAPLRATLLESGSAFNVPFAAMQKLGSAAPVLALIGVGASFVSDGIPTPSVIGYGPLLGLILARLVALPACAISIWVLLRQSLPGLFPADPVFLLVACLECCMPSAFNIVTMCTLQGVGEKEISGALFFQNLAAVPILTAWVAVILKFVV